jgi:hypothetical protein
VTAVLVRNEKQRHRNNRERGGQAAEGSCVGAWTVARHAERAIGQTEAGRAGPYAAEAMRRLVAGDVPPPNGKGICKAGTHHVVHAIRRVQAAAALVRRTWKKAAETETAQRAAEEAHLPWVSIAWGVWGRCPNLRIGEDGEPTDAALEAAARVAEQTAAEERAAAKRRRIRPEKNPKERRRAPEARSAAGGDRQGWTMTRAVAEWKWQQTKERIRELEERAASGRGTEAEAREIEAMTARVTAYEASQGGHRATQAQANDAARDATTKDTPRTAQSQASPTDGEPAATAPTPPAPAGKEEPTSDEESEHDQESGDVSTEEARIAIPHHTRVNVVHAHAHGRKRQEGCTSDGADGSAHRDTRRRAHVEVEAHDDTHNIATADARPTHQQQPAPARDQQRDPHVAGEHKRAREEEPQSGTHEDRAGAPAATVGSRDGEGAPAATAGSSDGEANRSKHRKRDDARHTHNTHLATEEHRAGPKRGRAAVTREANGAARETDKGGVSGESDDEQHKRKAQQTHRMQQAHGETKAMGSGPDSAPEREHANTGKEGSDRQSTTREAATAQEGRARARARTDEEARPPISQTCKHPLTKQTNTAPDRAARATAPTSGASGPVAAVLAGARRRNRVATYDETSHRTGPRKQKIPHIADARTATGRLTEEIKIGPQMIGMIEKSATLARTAEAAAGQRRQRYDDG